MNEENIGRYPWEDKKKWMEDREAMKKVLREWLGLSASMVVVDGRHGLPAKKKALEAKTREMVDEAVPNFT